MQHFIAAEHMESEHVVSWRHERSPTSLHVRNTQRLHCALHNGVLDAASDAYRIGQPEIDQVLKQRLLSFS